MTLNIGGVSIGDGFPTRFVAEISNNHNGSFMRAAKLIEAAIEAGADFIKFQCYSPSELVALRGDGPAPSPWGEMGWTMRTLYEKAATPFSWFEALARGCASYPIPWFSSVFGAESLALLESLNCPAYKIARLDNHNTALAMAAWETGKPVIVSEHAADESLGKMWEVAGRPQPRCDDDPEFRGRLQRTLTLYCPPGYPQQQFGFSGQQWTPGLCSYFVYDCCGAKPKFDGFSFHGTDPLPCVTAATLGAKIIEAHFQLDDEPSELEANVSLTASAFKRMVEEVRRVEDMLT